MQKLLVKESNIVSLNEEIKKLKAASKEADRGLYETYCQYNAVKYQLLFMSHKLSCKQSFKRVGPPLSSCVVLSAS